jgi:hypothetical protein
LTYIAFYDKNITILEENMLIRNFGIKLVLFFVLFVNLYAQEKDMNIEFIGEKITKSFGSFSIPEDWVEITRYSRNGKYFYSHNSEEISLNMTNISIEMGSNRYALDDHMTFRYAILRQLLMQSGSEVSGSGTFTKHNDPLYIFTIKHKDRYGDSDVTTIQYYIVGDKRHILICVTDFHNTIANANEVAQFIVDSFVWSE